MAYMFEPDATKWIEQPYINTDASIMSIRCDNEEERNTLIQELKNVGYHPQTTTSNSTWDDVVYLTGEEAEKLKKYIKKLNKPTQHPNSTPELPTSNSGNSQLGGSSPCRLLPEPSGDSCAVFPPRANEWEEQEIIGSNDLMLILRCESEEEAKAHANEMKKVKGKNYNVNTRFSASLQTYVVDVRGDDAAELMQDIKRALRSPNVPNNIDPNYDTVVVAPANKQLGNQR
jgi:hypothetical protein